MADDRLRQAIRAWHGAGADFDRFDDNFIGTGEGAQIYGYGHYAAERRSIARWYRDSDVKRKAGDGGAGYRWKVEYDPDYFETPESHTGGVRQIVGELIQHHREAADLRAAREQYDDAIKQGRGMPHPGSNTRLEEREEDLHHNLEDLRTRASMHDLPELAELHPEQLAVLGKAIEHMDYAGFSSLTPRGIMRQVLAEVAGARARDATNERFGSEGITVDDSENLARREFYFDREHEFKQQHGPALEALADKIEKTPPKYPGRLYELELQADPDKMLDWDELLHNQPYVIDQLSKSKEWGTYALDSLEDRFENPSGRHLHNWLLRDLEPKEAAQHLAEIGIHGIKYRDASSRDETDRPTYNYVIFDPNIIKVLRKYDVNDNLIKDYGVHLKAVDHDPFKE